VLLRNLLVAGSEKSQEQESHRIKKRLLVLG
jgi:hypothetical protein